MQSKATVSYQGGKQSYTFPFPYLSRQFVKVRYESGSGTTNLEYNRDYSVEGQTVLLHSPAPTDVTVYVYRQTPTSSLVDFNDGSLLLASEMDKMAAQLLHVEEENSDFLLNSAMVTDDDGAWQGRGRRIKNVLNPQNPQDVVTLSYLDSVGVARQDELQRIERTVHDDRNAAAQSVQEAEAYRDAASTSAQHAAASSSAAERSREAAAASEVHTRDMESSVRSMQTHIEGIEQNITSAKTAVETLHRGAREAASSASEKASSAAKSADSAAASAEKAQQAARMEGIVESKHLADGAVTPPKIGFTAGDIDAYTKGEVDERLAPKAPLASPALTGTPTAPTATSGTNNGQIASTAFVAQAIAALVNSSPAALDTLQELAAALGNDANFAATVTNALAGKVSKSGDTMTGRLTLPSVVVNDWFRATGSCGLYFEDRGGGWHMTDDDWIRAYNGKHIYTSGKMRCDGGFEGTLRGKADSAGNSDNLGGQSLQWILNQIGAAKTGIIAGNLAQNGWVKFANGLILQWGTVPPIQKNSVAFPIAFPAACFSVHCNNASESLYTNTYKHTVVTFKIGKTGFSYAFDDASAPVQWMAIGY